MSPNIKEIINNRINNARVNKKQAKLFIKITPTTSLHFQVKHCNTPGDNNI